MKRTCQEQEATLDNSFEQTEKFLIDIHPELNFCEKRDIQVKTFTDFPSVSDFFSAHFSSSAYLLFALIFFLLYLFT